MTLKGKSRIIQRKRANTQYITIPAVIAQDSKYPFKDGGRVYLVVDPVREIILIARTKEIIDKIQWIESG